MDISALFAAAIWFVATVMVASYAANRARVTWGWRVGLLIAAANLGLLWLMTAPAWLGGWGTVVAFAGLIGPIGFSMWIVQEAQRTTYRRIAEGEGAEESRVLTVFD